MIRQLIRKEIRLQRSSLAFAVAVVAVWGVLMVLAWHGDRELISNQLTMGDLAAMLQTFFVGLCLLVIIPLFVGAATVAEERKLGVWDWQLSLPASRVTQWLVKLGVGAAIVLVLALGVQPALDALLTLALGGPTNMSDRCPLPTFLLGMNAAYYLVPLLLMVSGAFVSSLVSDPYKAFFGGGVVFALVGACFVAADPTLLTLHPWQPAANIFRPFPPIRNLAPLLVVGLCVVVAGAAWFNVRFEALRWRRLAGEVLGMAVLACVLTAGLVYCEFSPAWLVSQDRRDVEPTIRSELPQEPSLSPIVDWRGIEPLLVRRQHTDSSGNNNWSAVFSSRPPLGRLYRSMGTNRLVMELNSVPLATVDQGWPANYRSSTVGYQFAEIRMGTKGIRTMPAPWGYVTGAVPGTSAYQVEDRSGGHYAVTDWPVPVRVGGVLWEVWKRAQAIGSPLTAASIGAVAETNRWPHVEISDIGLNGKTQKMENLHTLDAQHGFYEARIVGPDKTESWWLIRGAEGAKWTVLSKGAGPVSYAVSSDGKWYAENGRLRRPWWHGQDALTVAAVDGSASWTLASPEGNLLLTGDEQQSNYAGTPGMQELGRDDDQTMPVSPSGRFLAFVRTKAFQAAVEGGTPSMTMFPERVEVGVLDLQTGQEFTLMRQTPDRAARAAFKQVMEGWLWAKRASESKSPLASGGQGSQPLPSFDQYAENHTGTTYRAVSPPMAWAPGEDKLAVLYDEKIYLVAYQPEMVQRMGANSGVPSDVMGDFWPLDMLNVDGFQIDHLDFWDAKTLLVWGRLGLFKIDLEKTHSLGIRSIPEPVRR